MITANGHQFTVILSHLLVYPNTLTSALLSTFFSSLSDNVHRWTSYQRSFVFTLFSVYVRFPLIDELMYQKESDESEAMRRWSVRSPKVLSFSPDSFYSRRLRLAKLSAGTFTLSIIHSQSHFPQAIKLMSSSLSVYSACLSIHPPIARWRTTRNKFSLAFPSLHRTMCFPSFSDIYINFDCLDFFLCK